jgi:hypothetical protein
MAVRPNGIVTRHLESIIAQRLTEEPVVVLNGAQTVGKSTLLQSCARAHGVQVLDLDDLATRRAVSRTRIFAGCGSCATPSALNSSVALSCIWVRAPTPGRTACTCFR